MYDILKDTWDSRTATLNIYKILPNTNMLPVSGVITGAVVQKFGSAYSGMFGSFLAATGLVLSFFATSVLYLEFTMGILFGNIIHYFPCLFT